MTLDKNREKLLDFNFYNHTINNLKLTMSPLEIEQLLQKQPIIQRKAQTFKENTISFDKPPTNSIEIMQPQQFEKNISRVYSKEQPYKQKMGIPKASTQPYIVNKVYKLKASSNIVQKQLDLSINQDQKFRIQGIKVKKSSKRPTQTKKKYLQQEEEYQPSQQDFNSNTYKQLNSQNSSILSDEPAKKPQPKYPSQSQSSEQDNTGDEGTVKFFPKENEYFYESNQAEQKQMQEYKQIMKSMMMFGFGSKNFRLYLKQTKVKIDPAFFLECRPRYYKMVNNVIFKVAQSIEYFLEKDCSLKIRRMTYNEFVCIKNDMLDFKNNYKRKHAETIEKLIKIILNMEDVTLTERRVSALHTYILKKIDHKYKSPQRLGIKLKEKQLSKRMAGPPYTLRKERKLYNAFYKDDINMFDVKWKNQIQNWFLHYYYQDTSLTYCFQKLKKLYPQYRRKLTPYNLRNYFERILRIAFGKLKVFIQKVDPQLKLPKLSPVSNSAFKKIMSFRDYQKARLILVRLYREELTESNCVNFIWKINESIREFQAYESFGIIRRQYKLINMEGMNVISLRSRLNKNQQQREGGQQNNDQDEKKEESNTDERQKSSIGIVDDQNKESQLKHQQQNQVATQQEQSLGQNGQDNELFSNNQDYFHDED